MTGIARALAGAALCLCLSGAVAAQDLALPSGARQTASVTTGPDTMQLAIGPWTEAGIPLREARGTITHQAWRIEGRGITTLQILDPLAVQLAADGFDILYSCAARICGGFDFRFGIELLTAPAMYVDLTDFRYLAAADDETGRAVSVLVSGTQSASFVQISRALPQGTAPAEVKADAPRPLTGAARDLASVLQADGHVVLADLAFETGSAALGEGEYASLDALAVFLRGQPGARVALVGHTDAVGGLEGNIALSRRRAQSVAARLVSMEVPRHQIEAQGVGYLSPLLSNLTSEGREANRRVEAVLLSVE